MAGVLVHVLVADELACAVGGVLEGVAEVSLVAFAAATVPPRQLPLLVDVFLMVAVLVVLGCELDAIVLPALLSVGC